MRKGRANNMKRYWRAEQEAEQNQQTKEETVLRNAEQKEGTKNKTKE